MPAYINQIACVSADYECQAEFVDALPNWLGNSSKARRLRDIAANSGIEKRYTAIPHLLHDQNGVKAFYHPEREPSIAERMQLYHQYALPLALKAISSLDTRGVTHLIVASCTGYYAPGLDLDLIRSLNLSKTIKRTFIGHMGCYAALPALRSAHEAILADPNAKALVICVELCSLHMQYQAPMDRWVSSLLFSDGCAAAIVSKENIGMELLNFESMVLKNSEHDMAWHIGDNGFEMTLSANVPDRIGEAMIDIGACLAGNSIDDIDIWAIHPGGKRILDVIEQELALPPTALNVSREVLHQHGNMSSATVLFVLKKHLETRSQPSLGIAMAFGPGLSLESLIFKIL